jgi:hypothetical protein
VSSGALSDGFFFILLGGAFGERKVFQGRLNG